MFVRLASRHISSECVITYASKRIENLTRVVKGPSIGRLVARRLLADYVAYTSHIQRCMHRCEADETRHDGTIYRHQAQWIPASTRTTCFTLPAPDRFVRGLRFYRFLLSRLLVTHLQFYQGLSRRIYYICYEKLTRGIYRYRRFWKTVGPCRRRTKSDMVVPKSKGFVERQFLAVSRCHLICFF